MDQVRLEGLKYWWRMLPKSLYIWIAIVLSLIIIQVSSSAWRTESAIALLAALPAAIFQSSAAYHAKVSHCLECFSRCNESYAKLNGRLGPPSAKSQDHEHSSRGSVSSDPIIDYFNLCAEEHLMHKMGVIPGFVWRVWCSGIHACACADHVKTVWDGEKGYDYYGFDLERLMRQHHAQHGRECSNRHTCLWNTAWTSQCPTKPFEESA
jgi:hypothetical protein